MNTLFKLAHAPEDVGDGALGDGHHRGRSATALATSLATGAQQLYARPAMATGGCNEALGHLLLLNQQGIFFGLTPPYARPPRHA